MIKINKIKVTIKKSLATPDAELLFEIYRSTPCESFQLSVNFTVLLDK